MPCISTSVILSRQQNDLYVRYTNNTVSILFFARGIYVSLFWVRSRPGCAGDPHSVKWNNKLNPQGTTWIYLDIGKYKYRPFIFALHTYLNRYIYKQIFGIKKVFFSVLIILNLFELYFCKWNNINKLNLAA